MNTTESLPFGNIAHGVYTQLFITHDTLWKVSWTNSKCSGRRTQSSDNFQPKESRKAFWKRQNLRWT